MTRAEQRDIKNKLRREIAEFLKIQNHYFPKLITDIRNVLDGRNVSYITYEIEVILYMMILKNACSIASMQEMNEVFNDDVCVKNIYKILGLKEKKFLPHYVTINECLAKLSNDEIEKIRRKMIYSLIRKKSFNGGRFLNKYWLVIIDGTQLFSFKERHCENCLTKVFNRGAENEDTVYSHNVLEAKIVFGEDLVLSIATEFIENKTVNPKKQDCELNSFERLANGLKKMFPKLPICIMGDSLYACDRFFNICKNNNWEYLIRYKSASIPTLSHKYEEVCKMGSSEEKVKQTEIEYKRKPKINLTNKMRWVNGLEYKKHKVGIIELFISKNTIKYKEFQWLTSITITFVNANEFTENGRKRWLIENQGFNIQKNHRYLITHANSLNYNAMKNHYLLTQLADMILQLYERGVEDLKLIKRTISKISEGLLECLKSQKLIKKDFLFERIRVMKQIS